MADEPMADEPMTNEPMTNEPMTNEPMTNEPMADDVLIDEEARRRFVARLIEVDARGPAPDCEERLAAIHAEFDAECERLLAEQAASTMAAASSR